MSILESISTTLNNILDIIEEKHQKTDATVTDLLISLQEIKLGGYK